MALQQNVNCEDFPPSSSMATDDNPGAQGRQDESTTQSLDANENPGGLEGTTTQSPTDVPGAEGNSLRQRPEAEAGPRNDEVKDKAPIRSPDVDITADDMANVGDKGLNQGPKDKEAADERVNDGGDNAPNRSPDADHDISEDNRADVDKSSRSHEENKTVDHEDRIDDGRDVARRRSLEADISEHDRVNVDKSDSGPEENETADDICVQIYNLAYLSGAPHEYWISRDESIRVVSESRSSHRKYTFLSDIISKTFERPDNMLIRLGGRLMRGPVRETGSYIDIGSVAALKQDVFSGQLHLNRINRVTLDTTEEGDLTCKLFWTPEPLGPPVVPRPHLPDLKLPVSRSPSIPQAHDGIDDFGDWLRGFLQVDDNDTENASKDSKARTAHQLVKRYNQICDSFEYLKDSGFGEYKTTFTVPSKDPKTGGSMPYAGHRFPKDDVLKAYGVGHSTWYADKQLFEIQPGEEEILQDFKLWMENPDAPRWSKTFNSMTRKQILDWKQEMLDGSAKPRPASTKRRPSVSVVPPSRDRKPHKSTESTSSTKRRKRQRVEDEESDDEEPLTKKPASRRIMPKRGAKVKHDWSQVDKKGKGRAQSSSDNEESDELDESAEE